ncbi:MAG: hypothetical protein BGO26_11840 [Actinobacteria bacterium 69-20]|nr:MAG: hypothetical protein BGO26_11840 [Actinobacteria bacterium 69-20]
MTRSSVIDQPVSHPQKSAAEPSARAGRLAPVLMVIGGALAIAQVALPWFGSSTGWDLYYNTPAHGVGEIVAAYAVLVDIVAGVLLLLAGIAVLAIPTMTRPAAKLGRIAALVAMACAAWWIIAGPRTFNDLLSGTVGWYAFVVAGIIGLIGAGRALAGPSLTFDKVSFMIVFLGLPLLIFVVFVLAPFVRAIYFSMTDWKGFSPKMNFIGLDNYVKLWTDDKFRQALVNCIELGIVVPLVTIVLALAVASMVTVGGPSRGPVRGIRASSFYRVVSFFPYVVPAIVIGIIWAQVYNPSAGILNWALQAVGLNYYQNFAWLGDPSTAMAASMFVIIWSFVGFYAVLFIAAIKGISAEVYEAARLDGAGRFRTAVSVTVPLIRDTIQTAYIYLGIAALDSFVYMMALNPFGGPNNTTLTMSQDLYMTAFTKGQFGYATSMGVILAIVTLLFATVVFAVNRLTGGGRGTPRKRRREAPAATAVAPRGVTTLQAG